MERTPNIIATEINNIKEQTRKMALFNSIEIGRRLVEAKSLLSHGEWGEWLKSSVNYSQRTASNLMRIFEEYGSTQITLLSNNSNSQALANLSYTQAVALLGISEVEREIFVKENDIDNMTTRELQKAIKERDRIQKEKEELEEKLKEAEEEVTAERENFKTVDQSYKILEKVNHEQHEKSEQLKKELEETKEKLSKAQEKGNGEEVQRLQDVLNQTENELANSQERIEDLERQLKEKPVEVNAETIIEKIPEEVEKELQELRAKVNKNTFSQEPVLKFSIYFDELVKVFKDLLGSLEEIEDIQKNEKYKNAVKQLIDKMNERL